MHEFEIEVRVGNFQRTLYIKARTEREAVAEARRQAKTFLTATSFRFANYITC